MSSGISIESGRLKGAVEKSTATARTDEGFHPWHFFVLVSILLATVAVFVARRSTPENLILLSLTIGAVGAAAAAFYRTLRPFTMSAAAVLDEPLTERRRATLERDKMLTLRTIKELEFDRAMGKLSQKDFDEMSGRLRSRAVALMKELDRGGGYASVIEKELAVRLKSARKVSAACACGTANDADAVFCKSCGTRLVAA